MHREATRLQEFRTPLTARPERRPSQHTDHATHLPGHLRALARSSWRVAAQGLTVARPRDVKTTEKYAHICPDATGREAMEVLDRIASINSTKGDDPKRPHIFTPVEPPAVSNLLHAMLKKIAKCLLQMTISRRGW